MPEARDAKPHTSTSHVVDRASARDADLAGIDALIDRLLPALTERLARTHLGELEVREGEWRIRLRRPAGAASWNGEARRASDRAERPDRSARGQAGHDGHAHARASADPHRGSAAPASSNGTGHAGGHPPRVATSPAVGVFRPGPRATVGTRVREGDSLGNVDVLGVPEEVRAPGDGLITELLVEAGTAVEYGQELLVVAGQPGASVPSAEAARP